ncbi:flavin-binding monooxygenase-like protein [Aspergillus affinis]|uniref:flavin-binding monooxygenase-like protein n=1 Tax=Aspergillus affinis TaxID=1070780 RepID=UPI0022FE8CCE|nr:flavin-binding monooxygenase-like protein [Aspergillus affinis]KAI9044867.1 flavin-binding monooxygenase-like protein [Aspergillus affinis]
MTSADPIDVVIIGAGWSGLSALKTYHEVHPNARIELLETASSIGGVWAKHRLYAGLKSNNMRGTYEFSDFPMDEETFGVKDGEHIPGAVVQRYMEAFVERFNLKEMIRLGVRVESVRGDDQGNEGGWVLETVESTDIFATKTEEKEVEKPNQTIHTRKLIVCTGITSQSYLPTYEGQDTYAAPLLHCRDLPLHQDRIFQPNARVTVFGGTKSAWDAVYAAASAGAHVDWIIRSNGHGPVWMAPPYVTPLKKWLEKLVTTRLLTWFSPCIWGPANTGIRHLLHGTWLGRKITDAFWFILGDDVVKLNRYDAHPETRKLKPWVSPFWVASGLSILNYPTNFFDLVTGGRVQVHVNQISHLSERAVHLVHLLDKNGDSDESKVSDTESLVLPSDALISCTGWQATPNLNFQASEWLPHPDLALGFPWSEDPIPKPMVSAADSEILTRFPRLIDQPSLPSSYKPLAPGAPATARHPFRLYRFMVPPALAASRSIAFMGLTMTINTTMVAQAQALWIAAYFGDFMALTPRERCPEDLRAELHDKGTVNEATDVDLLWETALHSQFGVHRYPGGFGKRNPDFVFDALPYVDLLLGDLGLDIGRKQGGLKWLEPYGMEDYQGLVGEFMSGRQ